MRFGRAHVQTPPSYFHTHAYNYLTPPRTTVTTSTPLSPPLQLAFNAAIQFWTSRGVGVLDVDYRGSTGFGRAYRRRLRGNWGVTDLEDVVCGARFLVGRGQADPARLAIDGGSAGGLTTLGALARFGTFTAGCSLYGVADLSVLQTIHHLVTVLDTLLIKLLTNETTIKTHIGGTC